jgi:tRNA pseudouridine55 synthase
MIRRSLGGKVGHCGTLDPPASGVLPLCLGAATRLSEFLHRFPKGYEVWATFGISTITLDAQGEVIARQPQPALSAVDVEKALPLFVGEIQQVPPLISAVHFGGRRLYQLARRGEEVKPPPKTLSIYRLRLLSFRSGSFPVARLEVLCSAGTYVRSLCRDLGEALGCPAHVSRLVRTQAGPFRLEHSISLAAALREAKEGDILQHVIPLERAGLGLPVLCLDEDLAYEISHGREITIDSPLPTLLDHSSPNSIGNGWLLVNNPSSSILALCEAHTPENHGEGASPTVGEKGALLLKPKRVLLGAAGAQNR